MRSGGTHNDMTHGVVDAGLGKTLVAAALIRTRFRGS
jgi:ERCC4-related helicase